MLLTQIEGQKRRLSAPENGHASKKTIESYSFGPRI